MKTKFLATAVGVTLITAMPLVAQIPPSVTTADKVQTSIGTLTYKYGAPSK